MVKKKENRDDLFDEIIKTFRALEARVAKLERGELVAPKGENDGKEEKEKK